MKPSRRDDLEQSLYVSKTLESTFAEISQGSSNLIIGTIYKHPFMKANDFLEKLGPILDKISSENKTVVLMGDFNLDLLKFEIKPEIFKFLDTLSSFLLKPQITLPTRITENSTSLIDNIFISAIPYNATSGNFISGISDHLIQFSILNNTHFDNSFDKAKGFYRDW